MTAVSIASRALVLGRYAKAVCVARGEMPGALAFGMGSNWNDSPAVVNGLKASVAALRSDGDASVLAPYLASELTAAVQPISIVGRLAGLHRVPLATRLLLTAAGASAGFVGQGSAIPVTSLDLDDTGTLEARRISALVVVTDELTRHASPAAEAAIGAEVVAACALALDAAFIDPTNAGAEGVRPAAVTADAPSAASSGNDVASIDADLRVAMGALTDAGSDLGSAAWVMRPSTAAYLCTLRGSGGGAAYAGITAKGGTLAGLPVIPTTAVPDPTESPSRAYIALVDAGAIAFGDDGEANVEFSKQAAVQLSTAPSSSAAQVVDLWSRGLVSLRVSRSANWRARRDVVAAVIRAVEY